MMGGGVKTKPMTLDCTALCQPMRGLVSLSKLSAAQLRPHPYWASMAYYDCTLWRLRGMGKTTFLVRLKVK